MSEAKPPQHLVSDDGSYELLAEPTDANPRARLLTYHDIGLGFDVTPVFGTYESRQS